MNHHSRGPHPSTVVLTPTGCRQAQYRLLDILGRRGAILAGREDAVSFLADNEGATSDAGREARPKLMIVDDDPEVRIVVAEFLEEFGYRVLQADGGAQALELLE